MARRKPAPPSRRSRWTLLLRGALSLAVVGALAAGWLVIWLARDLPDTTQLAPAERTGAITLLDREGRVITRRGGGVGVAITADHLPERLVTAVLAVEDRRFYSHFGIDLIGTGRAALANMRAGGVVQGGSTITQQLAKNLFLSPERTYRRKAQEMMLALMLEHRYSKDEILALYLNRVYFGAGAWGADAASQRYFSQSVHDLSWGEAALLAGLLKAPSRYSPASDARRAAVRATVVLDLMHDTGAINEAERVAAAEVPIRVSRGLSSPGAGWFADWVVGQVREQTSVRDTDLVVYTTLDVDAQRAAELALTQGLADPEIARGAQTGALIALDGAGGVRALVGGTDYTRSPFNRAINARRQPGSAFKPFVYAAAFEGGFSPDDVFDDAPVSYGTWSPENYNARYEGRMTLEEAFATSSNAIAVQLSEATGRGWVLRTAQRMGIESPMENTRAVALGAYEVTPLELAGAYAPFMNGGLRVDPHAITRIETAAGETVFEREIPAPELVLAARVRSDMDRLFAASVARGTSRNAAVPGRIVRGKTGTTNDNRDAWFVGWSDGLLTAVWTGNDDGSPTDHAVGGAGPARIFARFVTNAPAVGAPSTTMVGARAEPGPVEAGPDGDAPVSTPAAGNDAIGALLQRLGSGE
ncbi:transglycosylase domain-containing protein [Marinicauda pacifica]|uniref:transglycosylase domain-containing protein n=1 Tax=Marinicauda pacifica TaxID=1133559 RepID=UPI0035C7D914